MKTMLSASLLALSVMALGTSQPTRSSGQSGFEFRPVSHPFAAAATDATEASPDAAGLGGTDGAIVFAAGESLAAQGRDEHPDGRSQADTRYAER